MSSHHLGYRPDIDGLRAVAVLGVVLYHAGFGLVPGGFVGVDVFFVLSGFLITSILLREEAEGGFSLARFFERRIRRIAPALFLMMATTVAVSSWCLLPHQRIQLGRSVMATTLLSANYHFHQVANDYFHAPVESMPLLHTWSLAVEEQFYLLFPLVLWILGLQCCRSTWRVWVVQALGLVSFVVSVGTLRTDPSACFYLLPSRAWELLLGAVLALSATGIQTRVLRLGVCGRILGPVGLGMILSAMVLFDRETRFPGPAALLPCLGTAFVIVTGSLPATSGRVHRILSSGPAIAIGKISYSVYLWHWPLIVFTRDLEPRIPGWGWMVMGGSLLLGAASWRFVENPFRRRDRVPTLVLLALWIALSGMFLGYARLIRKRSGFLQRPDPATLAILRYERDENPLQSLAFGSSIPADRPYVYGATNVIPRYALWGDSHADTIAAVMGDVARRHGQAFKFYGRGGTKPILGVYTSKFGKPESHEFDYTTAAFAHILSDTNLTTVVLYARWITNLKGASLDGPDLPELWTPAGDRSPDVLKAYYDSCLRDTIQKLQAAGKRVVLMYPTPELGVSGPQAVLASHLRPDRPVSIPDAEAFFRRQRPIFEIFDALPAGPGLVRVRPHRLLIEGDRVLHRDGEIPLHLDDNHLNQVGAARLTPIFDQRLRRNSPG